MSNDFDTLARGILNANDRGGYTIPTAGLYPYQWNWDSVFVALGFATFDEDRAWREIEALFAAQWPNGMVPHIVFRREDPDYFPGPDVWDAGRDVPWPTSGLSQPPIAATAVRWIFQNSADRTAARDRMAALVPKLAAWHRWWHEARDPAALGIIAISHPWESGRDNLPDWDRPGAIIDTSRVGSYNRRDTSHVNPHMRPSQADYDRYIALVQFGRERHWDPARIAAENPFWVADVGVTAILMRAERDLAALAAEIGAADTASAAQTRIARMQTGFERLWNEDVGAYCSLDLRADRHAETANAATFLCFYAGAGAPERRARLLGLAARWQDRVTYLMPSFDPTHDAFDPLRYWRGPVWAIFNFMIATGLAECGETGLAERLRADTRRLAEIGGFAEYYSAIDGQPAGGNAFSWTAAVWLAWAGRAGTNPKG